MKAMFSWRPVGRVGGLLLLVGVLAGCILGVESTVAPPPTTVAPSPTAAATDPAPDAGEARTVTILYTNDEHGWMQGMDEGRGAAHLVGLWRERLGYEDDGPFLLLSGGDMWTGPAISTWFDGQSMAEVMNAMGYDAAAVGNHEFDFGLDALRQRAAESDFPFVSANIRRRDNGQTPTDIGIEPYTIVEVNGVVVGIIGLTTTSTPWTTNPANVVAFDFIDYEEALREVVPEVEARGAQLILVPAHVCEVELAPLANAIQDLGVHMLGGGHCNELFAREIGDIVVLEGGFHYTGYAHATFSVDSATGAVTAVDYGTQRNSSGMLDRVVGAVVARWADEAESELNAVIGYTDRGIDRRGPEMLDLIPYAWLHGYPTADVAITNLGGMRAAIPRGEITLADVVGVMPFNNVIVEVRLDGAQLQRVLLHGNAAVAGAYRENNRWLLDATGEPPDPDATYSLLVNDFMYNGGDGYELLAEYDPDAYNTAIDWRQPVIDWIVAQGSTPDAPIENALATIRDR